MHEEVDVFILFESTQQVLFLFSVGASLHGVVLRHRPLHQQEFQLFGVFFIVLFDVVFDGYVQVRPHGGQLFFSFLDDQLASCSVCFQSEFDDVVVDFFDGWVQFDCELDVFDLGLLDERNDTLNFADRANRCNWTPVDVAQHPVPEPIDLLMAL